METARLIIQGEDIRQVTRLLAKKESIYYKYETKDVVILMDEEYYFRIESNLMSVYIFNFKDEKTVEIEMVVGGGSHGIDSSFGAETKEAKNIVRSLLEICKEKGWEIIEIYPEEFKQSLEKATVKHVVESVFAWFKKDE